MKINILAFGIAKEIVGGQQLSLEVKEGTSVQALKAQLTETYPDFTKLKSLKLAVNGEYVADDLVIGARDEVVIIPPVSGG